MNQITILLALFFASKTYAQCSGIITTVAGTGTPGYSGDGGSATSSELHDPQGVAVDRNGNIFIVLS